MPAFNPPATIAEQILIDLACPETTLRDIALRASTSLDELCLWLASPAIAARTSAIESAMFAKARLTAANHLPFIVHAAAELLSAFLDEDRATSDPKLRHRAREAARKAMHLLTRLARITPCRAEQPDRPRPTKHPAQPPAKHPAQVQGQDPAQSLAQDPAQSLAPAPGQPAAAPIDPTTTSRPKDPLRPELPRSPAPERRAEVAMPPAHEPGRAPRSDGPHHPGPPPAMPSPPRHETG